MIAVKDIRFSHSAGMPAILDGISFMAEEGKLTTILGPNGCGKSTLFRCIAGLWKPDNGEITFQGIDITSMSSRKRAELLAVVPQDHEPPFPYSVFDAVLMGRAAHVGIFSCPSKRDRASAEAALEEVGISHLRNKSYTKISGGERQMVLVARAIAQDSSVMFFDEPTSHLDFRNQVLILRRIREIISRRRVIALLTIHDPNAAMLFSDSVVLINRGRVIAHGAPEEVITEDLMRALYGIDVVIGRVNGSMVITPRTESDQYSENWSDENCSYNNNSNENSGNNGKIINLHGKHPDKIFTDKKGKRACLIQL